MELWRECVSWLVKCKVIPEDHGVNLPGANIEILSQSLRDGVILCNLLIYLDPKSLGTRVFNRDPKLTQSLCYQNIELFLELCRTHFEIPGTFLFEPAALYGMSNFPSVIQTLTKLSQCPKVIQVQPQLKGFGIMEDQDIEDLERELFNFGGEESPGPSSSRSLQIVDLFKGTEESTPNKAPNTDKSSSELARRDSSDDEDPDTYFSRKFNEYGTAIQQHMKKTNEERKDNILEKEVRKSINVLPSKVTSNANSPLSVRNRTSPPPPAPAPMSIFTDPIFGMRIIRPLISSALLVDRMSDKKPVSSIHIKTYVDQIDKSIDWVVAGAIISKSPVRMSQKGEPYSIWQISDLRGADVKTVCLFLFKGAHTNLWKTAQGMVIAVLNPNVFEGRANSKDEATISVDNVQKVMILGQSKDLGTCKSNKKNGDPCGSVVNLRVCEYCIFHVKKEYKNVSQRSELQSSTAGRGLNDLRSKVLGKSEVFYAGQTYSAVPALRNAKLVKKDQDRLLTLSEYFGTTTGTANTLAVPKKRLQSAQRVESTSQSRSKDLERLNKLMGNKKEEVPSNTVERTSLLNSSSFKFSQAAPKLSEGEFTFEVKSTVKQAELRKLKAVQILKQKPLPKANPNFVKYRGSATTETRKRIIDDLSEPSTSTSSSSSPTTTVEDTSNGKVKRLKLEEPKPKEEELRKSRIQRIMEASSSHSNLIHAKENEAQQKYFDVLERKEAMEEKMIATFKMPCKAVICLKCKYMAFKASDMCKELRHPFKLVDAEKRFFKCGNCNNRTASLERFPKFPCTKCHSISWTKTGMMEEKTISLSSEKLSIRGDEEMYIGGANSKNINLNLHVAEDGH